MSCFEKTEVFIAKGQSVDGFLPTLIINNVGLELPATSEAAANRRKILDIEANMPQAFVTGEVTPCEFSLVHTFTEGNYARQITLPAGSIVVGKIHKHAHLNFVLRGRCSVMTEVGVTEIVAPCMFVSTPGTKRAVYTHEETVWVTVHATTETDLAVIEETIIAKTFEELGLSTDSHTTKEILWLGQQLVVQSQGHL